MTLNASVGEFVQIQFPAFDIDGITPMTGLADGDFSKLLLLDNTVSAVTITVSEVGSTGRYVMSFTPNGDGLWYAEVTTTVDDIFADQVEVGPPPDDWIDAIVAAVWAEVLPGTFAVGSAGYRLARVDDAVQALEQALVMARLTVSGGDAGAVETNATKIDGYYDDLTVVVSGSGEAVARRIEGYLQANGKVTFNEQLPFTPQVGDDVIVLGILGKVAIEEDTAIAVKLMEIHQRLGLDAEYPLCITKMSHEADGWKLTHTTIGDKIIVQRGDS